MKSEIDPVLRLQIVNELKAVMANIMEVSREEWVSGDELGRRFAFFTRSWLRTYGQLLPRERVSVVGSDGEEHRTGWCYPVHRIERMIHEGKLRRMVMLGGKGRASRYEECLPTIAEMEKACTLAQQAR